MEQLLHFLPIAEDLELAGLIWRPEIGDEVSDRKKPEHISVLVDPEGMTPSELRSTYLWLPTVEQMVMQIEARQAILFHAGLELSESSLCYKAIVRCALKSIESKAVSLRTAMGLALRDLILTDNADVVN